MLFFIGIGGVVMALSAISEGHYEAAGRFLALAGVLILPVVVQWARNRDVGAFDLVQGGVMWVRQNPSGVHWSDWGLLFTRSGSLDLKANYYEVRYRFCYGLIPYRKLEGRLKDLGSVRLSETGSPSETTVMTWTVHLDVEGKDETIFDAAGTDRNRGSELAEELTEALRGALARRP
tara:strand:+ start:844 stop:1374 length:531 start_codon:yes stop_codon:yes gene_type:complete